MTTNSPLLSIIVPVYKVENYLQTCIESILTQNFTDYELILVDDGSPDNCGKICEDYAKSDSRIHVIHKKNGGLSSARNAALDIAKGKYISFIDSDDYISRDYFNENMSYMKNHTNVDMISVPISIIKSESSSSKTFYYNIKNDIIGKEEIRNYLFSRKNLSTVCAKIYKRDIWHDLRFKEGIFYEDTHLLPDLCERIRHIHISDIGTYSYILRSGSITSTLDKKKTYDYILIIFKILNYLKQWPDSFVYNRWIILSSYNIHSKKKYMNEVDFNNTKKKLSQYPICKQTLFSIHKFTITELFLLIVYYIRKNQK